MKFVITRSISFGDESPPCDGAKRECVDGFETRTCSEEEFDRKFSAHEGLWRSKGFNHTVTEEGYIQRIHKDDTDVWVLDFKDLDSLMSFHNKYGDLVLTSCWSSRRPEIEIYDGYRE